MSGREVLSVGIDVGTTTTQLVLSRLLIRNRQRPGLVPRLDVDSSATLYQSEPAETPMLDPTHIDVAGLRALIEREYAQAAVAPAQIGSGAVIITGESARSQEAQSVLDGLSGMAGEFVCTVAGPNVEAQIAGRGSGAAEWSAQRFATVVNVDVGGGSSNAAAFRVGAHTGSSAIMVGGRQARLDRRTQTLTHLAPSGAILNDELRLGLRVGTTPSYAALRALTDAMADLIVDLCLGVTTPLGDRLALSAPLPPQERVTAYFVSGGVGLLYYDNVPAGTLPEVAAYGDVGPLLARSLRENPRWAALPVQRPPQTLRATVLGAASQQVTLSGSTIWADAAVLPLRSLPVIHPRLDTGQAQSLTDPEAVRAALVSAIARFDRSSTDAGIVAIVLDVPAKLDYPRMRVIADGITRFTASSVPPGVPFVLVLQHDYAQILGQTINGHRPELPLVVIDQIGVDEGDFIDIGAPLMDGRVVPVSVKTLVFYR